MSLGYQHIDRRVIDYNLWYLPDFSLPLRGPRRFREDRPYVSFVGAAQTFGRFTPEPFPAVIGEWCGIDHLNLGFAGAGPEYFLQTAELLARINRSQLCFLQVMSGRSVSTTLMRAVSKGAVLEFTRGPLEGQRLAAADAYSELLALYDHEAVLEQVADAKRAWVSAYKKLIEAIDVPVVLLWVSRRTPQLKLDLTSSHRLLGPFPQLIDRSSFEAIQPGCADVIEATFVHERPHMLTNMASRMAEPVYSEERFPHRREWSRPYNVYYPSPRMHGFVAREVIDRLYRSPDLQGCLGTM